MNVAAKVAAEKEAHPERFCPVKRCLWRTVTRQGANPCRNHPREQRPVEIAWEDNPRREPA